MHLAAKDAALARLLEGNRRYVEGRPRAPIPSAHRVELAAAQQPFAVILGCSDSRVPVETIFDQGKRIVQSAPWSVPDNRLLCLRERSRRGP